MKQEERESRRLWRHVTLALFRDNIDVATQGCFLGGNLVQKYQKGVGYLFNIVRML